MIKAYLLPVIIHNGAECVTTDDKLIHRALLQCTEDPKVRRLVMDTTPDEDRELTDLAIKIEEPTENDIEQLKELPPDDNVISDIEAEIEELKARLAKVEAGG